MSALPDPTCRRLMRLSVHELRTPLTVVAGYASMLLKDTAGPLNDKQRRLLQEAAKATGRMAELLKDMSKLAELEAGTVNFNRSTIDLHALLAETIADLPPASSYLDVRVTLADGNGTPAVPADRRHLKDALTSLIWALRRELVTSRELFVRERTGEYNGRPAAWVAIGNADHIDALDVASASALNMFDEWRGGLGLSLPIARRIIQAHGGALWSLLEPDPDDKRDKREQPNSGAKAAAVLVLPVA